MNKGEKMNYKEGTAYAMARGRVTNTSTGKTGNLVEWCRGDACKVFVGYDRIGACQLPTFERWLKAETVKESNTVPVSK